MKTIITILLVFVISLSGIGQISQRSQQKLESFTTHKRMNTLKKSIIDKKNPHYRVNSKQASFLKSTQVNKKRLDDVIYQYWNTNQWFDYFKEEYTYNANEREMTEIDYDKNGAVWDPSGKYEYVYNSSLDVAELIIYEWNTTLWAQVGKIEYIYNAGKLTTLLIYEWNTNQWVLFGKIDNTYDGNGNLTVEIISIMNVSQWVALEKYEHTYVNTNRTVLTAFEWNMVNSQWDNNWKDEYTYDGSGKLLIEIDSYWENPQWVDYDKFDYTYDGNGNTIREIKSVWNTTGNQWDENWKYEYTFNLAYDGSDLIVPLWYYGAYDYTYNNMVTVENFYDFIDPDWVNSEKFIYNYSDYESTLDIDDEILSKSISLYPNPVSDILTINSETPLTKVEFYSVLGKKVKEINSDFKSIRTDNLSNGFYIVRIQSENGLTSKKLIKKD